jgi:excisionase family DNA binding protein
MDTLKMPEKWLTIEQIADYFQVSKEKIYKLCQRGRMPASKIGGQWRFDIKEVDLWARKQRPKRKAKR